MKKRDYDKIISIDITQKDYQLHYFTIIQLMFK
jgi:hypothetical protein